MRIAPAFLLLLTLPSCLPDEAQPPGSGSDLGVATMDGRMPPPPPPDGMMPPPPDGMMPPPPDGMMMPPPDGMMMPPPDGMMGPKACTVPADCVGACPPGSQGCTCATNPMGQKLCVPTCTVNADCPVPPMGPALSCRNGICAP